MSDSAHALLELFDFSDGDEQDRRVMWFDKVGIIQLDDDRRATITLSEANPEGLPTHAHFRSFKVEIISKTHGPITAKTFYFDEYLRHVCRIDDRQPGSEHPYDHRERFWLGGEVGLFWYIAIPETTEPLTTAILEYIEMWR